MVFDVLAVNNYVVGRYYRPEPASSNISLPGQLDRQTRWVEALKVGPGVPDFRGETIPPVSSPGRLLYVMAHGHHPVDLSHVGGEELVTFSDLDVMGGIDVPDFRALPVEKLPENFQPFGHLVEIKKIDLGDDSIGIEIPGSLREPPNIGIVTKVGTGWRTIDGTPIQMHVSPGDIVVFARYQPMVVDYSPLGLGHTSIVVAHGDIVGKLVLDDETRDRLLQKVV